MRLYSKSLDREEMLALLAEHNVMRAQHTSSFEPTFTYKVGRCKYGEKGESLALVPPHTRGSVSLSLDAS